MKNITESNYLVIAFNKTWLTTTFAVHFHYGN